MRNQTISSSLAVYLCHPALPPVNSRSTAIGPFYRSLCIVHSSCRRFNRCILAGSSLKTNNLNSLSTFLHSFVSFAKGKVCIQSFLLSPLPSLLCYIAPIIIHLRRTVSLGDGGGGHLMRIARSDAVVYNRS
jgi:hypothetical protein